MGFLTQQFIRNDVVCRKKVSIDKQVLDMVSSELYARDQSIELQIEQMRPSEWEYASNGRMNEEIVVESIARRGAGLNRSRPSSLSTSMTNLRRHFRCTPVYSTELHVLSFNGHCGLYHLTRFEAEQLIAYEVMLGHTALCDFYQHQIFDLTLE